MDDSCGSSKAIFVLYSMGLFRQYETPIFTGKGILVSIFLIFPPRPPELFLKDAPLVSREQSWAAYQLHTYLSLTIVGSCYALNNIYREFEGFLTQIFIDFLS